MTDTTHDEHQLWHVAAEMESLRRIIPLLVESWATTGLLAARIGNVWALLKMMERDIKSVPNGKPIDPDDQINANFQHLAESINALIRRLDQLGVRNIRIRIIHRLLMRLHGQIEQLRTRIREHDADCPPPLHGPYERIEELIDAPNTPPTFIVKTAQQNGIWTGECDPIGLVTEADSFEELTRRAWEIAPELAELNGYHLRPDTLRLHFEHIETSPLPPRRS